LAHVAGALAVTFTGAGDTAPASESPPVQRPAGAPVPPELPPDRPSGAVPEPEAPPADDPTAAPADDTAVADPAGEPAEPPPPEPTPPPPRDDAPLEAADDEAAPIAKPKEPSKAERVLRPTDRRGFFSMGAGGATGTSPYAAYFGGGMDFEWELAVGSHTRRWPDFGGAFVIQQRKGFINELTFAGRLQWDRAFSDAFAIYSSFNFDFGVNVPIGYAGYFGMPFPPSALVGLGWGVKAILGERFLLGLRPVSPNVVVPAFGNQILVTLRWDVIGQVGVVF
jgi:hypothetical protein